LGAFRPEGRSAVPKHWIIFPGGSPAELKGYENDPHGLEQEVANIVHDNGGQFDALWYGIDKDSGSAYVLVDGSKDQAVKIANALEGEATHLESVPERYRSLRGGPSAG
jgi:hypothetical protein